MKLKKLHGVKRSLFLRFMGLIGVFRHVGICARMGEIHVEKDD